MSRPVYLTQVLINAEDNCSFSNAPLGHSVRRIGNLEFAYDFYLKPVVRWSICIQWYLTV